MEAYRIQRPVEFSTGREWDTFTVGCPIRLILQREEIFDATDWAGQRCPQTAAAGTLARLLVPPAPLCRHASGMKYAHPQAAANLCVGTVLEVIGLRAIGLSSPCSRSI